MNYVIIQPRCYSQWWDNDTLGDYVAYDTVSRTLIAHSTNDEALAKWLRAHGHWTEEE